MTKKFKSLEDLGKALGATRSIQRILVANNGLAAVKGILSLRNWVFEHTGQMNEIHFVVMASPECLQVNAEHIKMGDETVTVPSGKNINNYANVDLIFSIATQKNCDAVYVGWGHASEKPELPRKLLEDTGGAVEFMGPPEGPMAALGDKIASSIIAQAADVPTLPWSGMDIKLDVDLAKGCKEVPRAMQDAACVVDVQQALQWAERIGYPVMLKASEGGGGKGIRKVMRAEELEPAFFAVGTEVAGPVFVMKMAIDVRHIEVQLLADKYGNVISLRTRECSVQRRQQKIIEEGPAFNLLPGVSTEMEAAAVRLAKIVGYVGLGTVEFLYDQEGKFYFLELNPRIQVEHPVTEMVTGVNLPAALFCVSMGIPLHRIPEVRTWYGLKDLYGDSALPLESGPKLPVRCNAIAVRVTAEDAEAGFQPCTGSVEDITFNSAANFWGYFSLSSQGGVHEFADSQFGHIFASGPTREDARRSMIMGLRNLSIRGDIRTTIHYVSALLDLKEFVECRVTTAWLDGLIKSKFKAKGGDVMHSLISAVIYKMNHSLDTKRGRYLNQISQGHIPALDLVQHELTQGLVIDGIKYEVRGRKCSPNEWNLSINKSDIVVFYRALRNRGMQITVNFRTFIAYVEEDANGLRVIINNGSRTFSADVDPTQLRSTVPGRLVRYTVSSGDHVHEDQTYAEVEVMKMLLQLKSNIAGVIKLTSMAGTTIPAGKILAEIVPDDPNIVKHAVEFEGTWASLNIQEPDTRLSSSPGKQNTSIIRAREAVDTFYCLLQGYSYSDATIDERLTKALEGLSSFCLSTVSFKSLQCEYFTATAIDSTNNAIDKLSLLLRVIFRSFYDVEKWFDGVTRHDAIHAMRARLDARQEGEALSVNQIFEIDRAHSSPQRQKVLKALLSYVEKDRHLVLKLVDALKEVSTLRSQSLQGVLLLVRYVLLRASQPTYEERRALAGRSLEMGGSDSSIGLDMLCSFLDSHENAPHLTPVAFEALLRTIYAGAYDLEDIDVFRDKATWVGSWRFSKHRDDLPLRHEGMVGSCSVDDLQTIIAQIKEQVEPISRGYGRLSMFVSETEMRLNLKEWFLSFLTERNQMAGHVSARDALPVVAMVFVPGRQQDNSSVTGCSERFAALLQDVQLQEIFANYTPRVAEVTFVVVRGQGLAPYMFTYSQKDGYTEDKLIRNIPRTTAFMLELPRLAKYDLEMIPTENPKVHLYYGKEKAQTSRTLGGGGGGAISRVFLRTLVFADDLSVPPNSEISDIEGGRVVLSTITALEIARSRDARLEKTVMNHIFIHCMDISLNARNLRNLIKNVETAYGPQLYALGVRELELRFKASTDGLVVPVRCVVSNATGYLLAVDVFAEVEDNSKQVVLKSMTEDDDVGTSPRLESEGSSPTSGDSSPLSPRKILAQQRWASLSKLRPQQLTFRHGETHPVSGQPVNTPYATLSRRMKARLVAQSSQSTYVHDWPLLFEAALRMQWKQFAEARKDLTLTDLPTSPMRVTELFLSKNRTELQKTNERGTPVGMVVWECEIQPPVLLDPSNGTVGKQSFILVANDITHNVGAFAVLESLTFACASQYARKMNAPFVYVSCNSGARMGLANEVKERMKIAFKEEVPEEFDYLYFDHPTFLELSKKGSVNCIDVPHKDGLRHRIIDVIGDPEDYLGVENLKGSGTIAGEMSLNYDTIPTISLVSGRSVGIGAYLVRLGHRVIQCTDSSIILTGFAALNRLLGKEVYTTNKQLGGNQIMQPNGVTHWEAKDDIEGVRCCLMYLGFLANAYPQNKICRMLSLPSQDPIDREVTFHPVKDTPYDPRLLLEGDATTTGLFDKGSFVEAMSDWAKSVVVGRARLGGIACGVIAVETRVTRKLVPADPADPSTSSQILPQAGQVWFPDSAHKTADALSDFQRERLPCIVLANWRGFSGGQRDMFDEVLKHGAHIVDNLRTYTMPVLIYIPPFGELRGGAWVVLDPAINHHGMVEMYADPTARGGILEPSGTVEIKFKTADVMALMRRSDPQLKSGALDEATRAQREKLLRPMYDDIAVQFADLHDTPGRMKAKNCIRDAVPWTNARRYFYARLRRRLLEVEVLQVLREASPQVPDPSVILNEWLREAAVDTSDDEMVAATLSDFAETFEPQLRKLRSQKTVGFLQELLERVQAGGPEQLTQVAEALRSLPPDSAVRKMLSQLGEEEKPRSILPGEEQNKEEEQLGEEKYEAEGTP